MLQLRQESPQLVLLGRGGTGIDSCIVLRACSRRTSPIDGHCKCLRCRCGTGTREFHTATIIERDHPMLAGELSHIAVELTGIGVQVCL